MKTRTRLLLVVLATGAASLCLAGAAGAAEGELSHSDQECLEILEKGGTVDECQEAPNPVIPEVNEIIWGGLFFAIVAFALVKFAFPALRQGMQAREERIRADLEGAEQARAQAEVQLGDYQRQLADARSEAGRIIDEARQAADQVRRDLIARAEEESAELRSRAQEDIRLATDRAMADIRTQVAQLSIDLAEKIVERNLDRETQLALVEQYIDQVGSRE